MDQITSMLDRLSDLNDGEIAELEGLILSEFETISKDEATPTTVEAMTSLADALDAVRAETSRRVEQQKELAKRAAEAASRITAAPPEDDMQEEQDAPMDSPQEEVAEAPDALAPPVASDEPLPEEMPEEPVPADEEDETTKKQAPVFAEDAGDDTELAKKKKRECADDNEAVAASAETTEPDQPKEDAVTASGNEPQSEGVVVTPPADHLPTATKPAATLTITAGADIPGYGAGSTLADMDDVSRAFAKRLHTLRSVTAGAGEQYTVATLNFDYPDDRRLSGDDASNWDKIRRVTSSEAITAAAGVCAPLTTIYDVKVFGVTDRPVRDALARFNADRGGVRVYPTPGLPTNSVGIWDTDGASSKTCGDALCTSPSEVMLDAVYACLKFSNFTNRFFPEMVKANTDVAMINHAKVAEQNLLKGIQSGSTKVTFDADSVPRGGAARTLLTVLDQAITAQRRRHRLSHNETLRAIIPSFALDLMRADLALQAPGDGIEQLAVADSLIEGFFRARNVNVTWSIETINSSGTGVDAAAQSAGALNAFPTEVNFALYPEGTFLFLDGGTLDLGIVRDGTMVSANEYSTFVETFEAAVKVGVESLWLTVSNLCVSGAASDLVDLSCSGAGS